MRSACTCLAVLTLGALGVSAGAAAAPIVKLKGAAIPIPGFPHTGNILGAGTALRTELTFSGSEYDEGHPPPVIGINILFPAGSKAHEQGFPTCSPSALKEIGEPAIGTAACPKGSLLTFPVTAAQPESSSIVLPNESYALGVVKIGSGPPVEEKARIQGFFAPGGGLEFFVKGVTPSLFEFISPGHVTNPSGSGSSGPEVFTTAPLIETLPGAADASAEKITVFAGAAYRKNGKVTYYATVPKQCPSGGFPVKAEVIFAEDGDRNTPVSATATFKAPCPRK
jgi:hypothetical protein